MDKAKKKTIKRIVSWVALAALVAGLAVMPLLARQEQEADGPVASILEATVQTGQISNSLKGGGTLKAGKAMEVNLPSGVMIKEFLVKNGDTVTEGTPVATVDRVSVMNAILAVEDTLDYLQKEIAKANDDTVSGTIKATAGGRVKQVFAQKGDSVQDVMLTHGALAVLSLDGRMAVALEQDMPLAAGDTVTITLPDNKEVDGRVESNLNGTIIVTVEDEKYPVGEAVTVTTVDGEEIGEGELYVHNAWHATAFSGTVNRVNAKEETEVGAGTILLTLTDTDFEGTMQSLANLHREYEELLQKLFVMYDTEVLTAPCDGMISGVNEDSPFLLAAIDGEEGWFVDLLNNETTNGAEKGWTVVKLTQNSGSLTNPSLSTTECSKALDKNTECNALNHDPSCYYFCKGTKEECNAKIGQHSPGCYYYCSNATGCTAPKGYHTINCPHNCTGVALCKATIHYEGCPEICTHSDQCKVSLENFKNHIPTCPKRCKNLTGCTAGMDNHLPTCPEKCTEGFDCAASRDNHKSGCPMLCNRTDACKALDGQHFDDCKSIEKTDYEGFVGYVLQNSYGKLTLCVNKTPVSFTYGNKKLTYSVDVESLAANATIDADTLYTDVNGNCGSNSIVLVTQDNNGVYLAFNTGKTFKNSSSISGVLGGMDISGLFGGLMGGVTMPSFGNYGSYGAFGGAAAQQVQLFDLNGSTLMTVTEREAMTLTIAIDEHDIAKVALGQIADVQVTALKGEIFEAEVTEIGSYGTNNGGSSKFPVELTMDVDERMLAGMNATAEIPMFTKMDVLTVPVAALVETVEGTVVYTALDSKTGEPASPVTVETGVSDGENVEILSGLKAGDKVYYSYYDVLELDHTAKNEFSW